MSVIFRVVRIQAGFLEKAFCECVLKSRASFMVNESIHIGESEIHDIYKRHVRLSVMLSSTRTQCGQAL